MTTDAYAMARSTLEAAQPGLIELSHRIYHNPELGYEEVQASAWLADALEAAGFETQRGYDAMPTAVVGSIGSGSLHIVICSEYDALPGVGHACGHNVICTAGLGAALALAPLVDELELTLTLLGTPAEEGGGGKIGFIEGGFFEAVHAAMMVHPYTEDVSEPNIIAVQQLVISYHGREAHASGFPWLGINAADAMVVAQTAIGLLRQQLLPNDRIHGFTTKGGDAANIIPKDTTADYMVRAGTAERLEELLVKVRNCFEAGALATGCSLEIETDTAYTDMRHDSELAAIYRRHAESLGRVFNDEPPAPVSTDMGNVSYVVPSIHPFIGIETHGAVPHQAAFADACATPSADQAIFDGALSMALTVIDMARDEAVRSRLLAG
ncbi:MAG TPA: amidohydrolase [Anaerolineae bacterium]|nr:amidohydrolase [Anaerolineae bacterium]